MQQTHVRRERNILYRVYDEDEDLLYVGATTNPGPRMQAHSYHSPWWDRAAYIELTRLDSRGQLLEAEAEAIRTEEPLYNLTHLKALPFKRRRRDGMGSISQRPNGYWVGQIAFRGADGVRHRKSFGGKERCVVEEKLAAFQRIPMTTNPGQ